MQLWGMSRRFCLVSHQHLFRTLLAAYLREHFQAPEVVECVSGEELLHRVPDLSEVDLLLLDAELPDRSAQEALVPWLRLWPRAKAALLTDVGGAYLVHNAIQLGLRGVLHKRDTLENFSLAVTTILAGGLWVSPQADNAGRTLFSRILSERETGVLALLGAGHSTAATARRLRLSRATVQTHRRNCMQKLGVRSQHELVLFALRHGLVALDRTARAGG
jgi:DNA-binding NarL/FixJ family response regulator